MTVGEYAEAELLEFLRDRPGSKAGALLERVDMVGGLPAVGDEEDEDEVELFTGGLVVDLSDDCR